MMSINMSTNQHPPRISGSSWTQNTLYLTDRGRWVKFENMDDGITQLSTTEIRPTDKPDGIVVTPLGDMTLYKEGVQYSVHSLTVNLAELRKRIGAGMTEEDRQLTNVPEDLFQKTLREFEIATAPDFKVGDAVKAKYNTWQQGVVEKVIHQHAIYVRLSDGKREKFQKSTLDFLPPDDELPACCPPDEKGEILEVEIEILNPEGEWCNFDVEIWKDGTIIDLHPEELQYYPSIFTSKGGRWDEGLQGLTPENKHLALNINSDYVRFVPEEPKWDDRVEGWQLSSMDDDAGYDAPRAFDELPPLCPPASTKASPFSVTDVYVAADALAEGRILTAAGMCEVAGVSVEHRHAFAERVLTTDVRFKKSKHPHETDTFYFCVIDEDELPACCPPAEGSNLSTNTENVVETLTREAAYEIYQDLHAVEDADADAYLRYAIGTSDKIPESWKGPREATERLRIYDTPFEFDNEKGMYTAVNPAETFWTEWRDHKIAMKELGFSVYKSHGEWVVKISKSNLRAVAIETTNTPQPEREPAPDFNLEEFCEDHLKFRAVDAYSEDCRAEIDERTLTLNRKSLEAAGCEITRLKSRRHELFYVRLPDTILYKVSGVGMNRSFKPIWT